jgi:hypothetical protein
MMYIRIVNDLPTAISEKLTDAEYLDPAWKSRWDWPDLATVLSLAKYLTAMTGNTWLGIDNSASTSPRYDLMLAPKVGDPVSYGFNGDYTPDGHIVRITPGHKTITTSTGKTYRRRGLRSSWLQPGGTWGMVKGHVSERNPHF